jgi:ATP synthase protein I
MVRSAMNEDGQWPTEAETRAFNNAASSAPSLLLSGMLLYGGVGWAFGKWLHMPALLPIGLVTGLLLASYLVYVRYGRRQQR